MTKQEHPLTERLMKYDGTKVLVVMPGNKLRWRTPKWRLGGWYVRDSYGWRELSYTRFGLEAGTM